MSPITNDISQVACILVNYRSPWQMLETCLLSLAQGSVPVRVIVVDNGSGDGVLEQARRAFPQITTVELPANAGFAAAVNRGLREVTEPYVLMLNTDAVLVDEALAVMLQVLGDAGDEVAAVAPKMLSSSHAGIIDAIGIVVPATGAAFNRGIGQCDLGQYDRVEDVAGVCFGAALIRRELFGEQLVGALYEDYFLYFEDSDWCLRAASRGYRFLTAPAAVVLHMHSGIARNESLDFKYRLIELNTLTIVTRNFESGALAARVVAARILRLLARVIIRRRYIHANLAVIFSYLRSLPRLLVERRRLKAGRRSPDSRIFAMATGEDAFFDTVAYRPQHVLESLIATYRHLAKNDSDPRYRMALEALYELRDKAARPHEDGGAAERVATALSGEPECVQRLLAQVRGYSG